MNQAHITPRDITLELLEGQTYTETVSSTDEGQQTLVQMIAQQTKNSAQVAVYVEGEAPIGLEYKDGAFSQIPVPEESPRQGEKQAAQSTASHVPVVLDEEDDDALDMPLVEEKVITSEPKPKPGKKAASKRAAMSEKVEKKPHPEPAQEAPKTTTVQAGNKPTAEDFYTAKPQGHEAPAKNGWRGFVNSFGLSLAPSNDELEEGRAKEKIQRGLKSHKTIMVANLKGGAGKTTIAYLLSSVLGRVRGGTVLAWDNNENRGTLAYRSSVKATTNTAIDLLHEMSFFENSGQSAEMINFVRPQGENKFDVLASQHQGSDKPVINGEGFLSLHEILRSFYRMIVVDTGNASNDSTWQAAAQTAAETIDALIKKGYQDKVANSVAVVIDTNRSGDKAKRSADAERLGRIEQHLGQHVRSVHVVPWERSLEQGGAIEWEQLSPKTHRALLNLSAAVIDGL